MGIRRDVLLAALLPLARGWPPKAWGRRPLSTSRGGVRHVGLEEVLLCDRDMLVSPEVQELQRRRSLRALVLEEGLGRTPGCLWTSHRGAMQLGARQLDLHFLGKRQLSVVETVDIWEKKLGVPGPALTGGKYQQELNAAYDAVHHASFVSRSLQRMLLREKSSLNKDDRSPVTVADFVVQALVLSSLARVFPNDQFIAEEDCEQLKQNKGIRTEVLKALHLATGNEWSEEELYRAIDLGSFNGTAHRVWVLDPIDGTKGFLRGEHFCIALALLFDGKPVVSALGCPNLSLRRVLEDSPETIPYVSQPIQVSPNFIYPPEFGSVFFAESGQGAYARALAMDAGAAIEVQVSFKQSIEEAVVCEAAESSHGNRGVTSALSKSLDFTSDFIRIDGQCKYCLVGAGAADANIRLPPVGYREKIWDHAAGSHFVTEAGGEVTDLSGHPLDFSKGRFLPPSVQGILSTNGHFHETFLSTLKDLYEEGIRLGTIKKGRFMDSA